jgi:hypothetical protein
MSRGKNIRYISGPTHYKEDALKYLQIAAAILIAEVSAVLY